MCSEEPADRHGICRPSHDVATLKLLFTFVYWFHIAYSITKQAICKRLVWFVADIILRAKFPLILILVGNDLDLTQWGTLQGISCDDIDETPIR